MEFYQIPASELKLIGFKTNFSSKYKVSLGVSDFASQGEEACNKKRIHLHPTSQVSIKARDVPELISSMVEVMTCKSNPDRGFWMKTSRSSGIYPDHEADMTTRKLSDKQQTTTNGIIIPRDHEFDLLARGTRKRRIKIGEISGPMAPARGALSVPQYHRKDESKILPTKRLGIDLKDI